MGSIKKFADGVLVTFTTEDLLNQPAWIRLPNPPRKDMLWADYLGNMIIRAAWHLVKTRASQYVAEYNQTDVEGRGEISVYFRRRKE